MGGKRRRATVSQSRTGPAGSSAALLKRTRIEWMSGQQARDPWSASSAVSDSDWFFRGRVDLYLL